MRNITNGTIYLILPKIIMIILISLDQVGETCGCMNPDIELLSGMDISLWGYPIQDMLLSSVDQMLNLIRFPTITNLYKTRLY